MVSAWSVVEVVGIRLLVQTGTNKNNNCVCGTKKQSLFHLSLRPVINSSDVSEIEDLSEPEFIILTV